MTDTKQQDQGTIRALLDERRGLEQRGLDDRVAQVDDELRRLGHQAVTAQKRATKRDKAPAQAEAAADTQEASE